MNIEKRTAETPNPAETTPITPSPAADAPKQPAGKPVIVYIMIMFIAAFLLMALSMLMHQRTTSEGIGELQHSFSAMADMQAQQEKVIELQEELSDAAEEKAELEAAISSLVAVSIEASSPCIASFTCNASRRKSTAPI